MQLSRQILGKPLTKYLRLLHRSSESSQFLGKAAMGMPTLSPSPSVGVARRYIGSEGGLCKRRGYEEALLKDLTDEIHRLNI